MTNVRFRTRRGNCPISYKKEKRIRKQGTRLFALNETWKENADIYRRMAKQLNLTDTVMWVLYTLRIEPGEMTQSQMCEFLHEPKQTVNSALKKMEADGLITLQSGANRRTKTIHLTDAGLALARKTADRRKRWRSSARKRQISCFRLCAA